MKKKQKDYLLSFVREAPNSLNEKFYTEVGNLNVVEILITIEKNDEFSTKAKDQVQHIKEKLSVLAARHVKKKLNISIKDPDELTREIIHLRDELEKEISIVKDKKSAESKDQKEQALNNKNYSLNKFAQFFAAGGFIVGLAGLGIAYKQYEYSIATDSKLAEKENLIKKKDEKIIALEKEITDLKNKLAKPAKSK